MEIKIIDNFFSEETFRNCQQYSLGNMENKLPTFVTNHLWSNCIVKDSGPILVNLLPEENILSICMRNEILERVDTQPLAMAFYYFYPGSHIPWHNDNEYSMGISVYLNDEWDRDHSGLFVYETENELKAIVPKRNRAVIQSGHVWHSVTPTTKNSEIRRSVQLFF